MINTSFSSIRKKTRLALPQDDLYLYRLGVALYGFNSINSFMTEIICHIDPSQDRNSLLDKTSGQVLEIFKNTGTSIKQKGLFPEIYQDMGKVIDLFSQLNSERTDFVHSYPITNKHDEQILHRRKDSKQKYFEITNDFLDDFISRLHNVSIGLYAIRNVVKPNL